MEAIEISSMYLWMKWKRDGTGQRKLPSYYRQPKFGITRHFMWVLGIDGGEKDNFEPTDLLLREIGPRAYINGHYPLCVLKGMFHCRNCKLMGSLNTFNEYNCVVIS